MNITPTQIDNWLELRIDGRLDAMTSDSLYAAVCEQVAKGHRDIRLDAEAVSYISSAGLRVMLQSHRKLVSVNGSFTIAKASPFVMQTITMSGFNSLLVK